MSKSRTENYYAILMAGGVGSRFWPSSTAAHPKQFIDVLGVGESLFQTTLNRLSGLIPTENIFVLTNKEYVEVIKEQAPELKSEQIVAEPVMRNTAPSILLGALKIQKINSDALTIVAPCDHWIEDEEDFLNTIEYAFDQVAENDRLISLGIQPDFPNTGYGYIRFDKEEKGKIKKVEEFVEKPSIDKAQDYLRSGNYVWNAGIFIWSAAFIIENFRRYLPQMFELFKKGEDSWNTKDENRFLEENYFKAQNISIDYGIMEKTDAAYLIPVNFRWNDLGTWSSVQQELPADTNGNTCINARVFAEDSENNIISTKDNKLVVLKDLSNYIVVDDEEVLMVIPKEKEQEIKRLREQVMNQIDKNLG